MNKPFCSHFASWIGLAVIVVVSTTGCTSLSKKKSTSAKLWDWNLFADEKPDPYESPLLVKSSTKKWWLPSWSTKKPPLSYSKNKGSTWDRFKRSNKRFWTKTAEILDPYPDPKPPSAEPNKESSFAKWFQPKETKKVESIQDFLSLPRVGSNP